MKELLAAKPFHPFTIYLSDGSKHEVPHPEFAWIIGNRVFVGSPVRGAKNADFSVQELAILHISRIKKDPHSKVG